MILDEALAVAQLIADGDISPELLQGLEDAAVLQEATGNHYDMTELVNGKIEDRGKFTLKPIQQRGGTNLPQTVDALLMAAESELRGEPLVNPMGETDQSRRVRKAADRILAPAGASQLAKVGLRAGAVEQLDGAERLLRAKDRLVELDRNFDPTSGARLDGVGLDGGHKAAHNANPELSAARENMQMENKYVNRVKGDRSGEAAAQSYKNSIIKRLRSDAISPLELVNRYDQNVPEVATDVGSTRVGSPGDNADRVAIIDSDGGDVNLHVKSDRKGRARISQIG